MLQSAIDDGVQTLLLLEDDVVLTDEFDETLDKVTKQLSECGWTNHWDTFHISANYTWGQVKEITPNVRQLLHTNYCFHCVALKRHMFQVMLDAPELGPMDLIHARLIQPNYVCLGVWPAIAPQKDSFSYVNGKNETYSQYFINKGQLYNDV
jgi:GR25 family glycosyltransferase involved in LPS biosynthesis